MSKAYRIYTEALHEHFKVYYANWPIGDVIALGDYGVMDGKLFIREGNIEEDYGIKIKPNIDSTKDNYNFKSSNSVSVEFYSKGTILNGNPLLKATMNLGFSSQNSVFFNSCGIRHHTIKNLAVIGQEIKENHKKMKWPSSRVFLSRIVEADNTIIAISGGSKSILELEAESELLERISLSDANLKLCIKRENGINFEILNKSGYYPLFGIAGIKPIRQVDSISGDNFEPKGKSINKLMQHSLIEIGKGITKYDEEFIFGEI